VELQNLSTDSDSVRLTDLTVRAVATFEATEAAASVVFRTVASVKTILLRPFLANVSEFTFIICYRPSACLSAVTFLRHILRRFKFSAIFRRH